MQRARAASLSHGAVLVIVVVMVVIVVIDIDQQEEGSSASSKSAQTSQTYGANELDLINALVCTRYFSSMLVMSTNATSTQTHT